MKEFTVKEPNTLKKFTDETYPQGSFYFNALLKKKDIRVNGVKVGRDTPLRAGDRVTYYTTPAQEKKTAFRIVYEDQNVFVADKESGVNAEGVFHTLAEKGECYFIHRLDRNTAGLMIFARNKRAEEELLTAFRSRAAEKTYHAICGGVFKKDADILTAYLQKDAENSLVRVSDKKGEGEKIITEYKILKREKGLNYVEITLHTGKTHQIRAHMAHIGCPVLGDAKYGDKALNQKYNLTRQCLLSKRLCFSFNENASLAYLNGKVFVSAQEVAARVTLA